MNENDPIDKGANGDDQGAFEQFLKHERRIPTVPGEWRARILSAATQTAVANEKPPREGGWRALLWPSPWAWGAIACAWALALGMNVLSGVPGASGGATTAARPEVVYTMLMEQRRLVREFFTNPSASGGPATPPPAATPPPGAWRGRRRTLQTIEA